MKKIFFFGALFLSLAVLAGGLKKDNAPALRQVLDRKGDLAFQKHDVEKACRCWQRVIKENPQNPKAYNKLGIAYLLLKEYDNAAVILGKGLEADKDNAGLNYNLGLACYYQGENEKALEQLKKVLALNEYFSEAYYLKGLCLENMGKIEEAKRAYIEELNHNPGSETAWKKVRREL